jgi:hypothetical protein
MAVTAVEWVPPILFFKMLLALKYTHADTESPANGDGGAEALRARAAESAEDGSDECGVALRTGVGGWKQMWKCMIRVPGPGLQDSGEGAAAPLRLPFA